MLTAATVASICQRHGRQFGRAASQQYVPAMYALAVASWRGDGVTTDAAVAETWLRRAAARSPQDAGAVQRGLRNVEDDGVEAASLLRRAAECGHKPAAAALAELHLFGRGVAPDVAEASRWLDVAEPEEACRSFHDACVVACRKGVGVASRLRCGGNLAAARSQPGSVDALYNLGSLYRLGKGVLKDNERALVSQAAGGDVTKGDVSSRACCCPASPAVNDGQLVQAACSAFAQRRKAGDSRALVNLALLNSHRGSKVLRGRSPAS